MNAPDVKYILRATKHDIVDFVYDHLYKFGWKTSYNYIVFKPKKFYNKPLPIPKGSLAEFKKYVNYCYLLSNNFTARDEASRYQDNNGLSIYFSVVLYWLLITFGVVNENKLKFCQGYFTYQVNDNPTAKPRYRAGIHAWLNYLGAAVDITIWQQKTSFNFDQTTFNPPLILGELPEGLDLFGFEETKGLAKEYARRFARESGMNFYDWINFHKQQADMLLSALKLESENNTGHTMETASAV